MTTLRIQIEARQRHPKRFDYSGQSTLEKTDRDRYSGCMGRNILSEYKHDAGRTAAETLALAEASKAQLLAPEPLSHERRLVVIDTWARSLGDAWQDFDGETSKAAGAQVETANEILKNCLEKEIFWGGVKASVIAGSEEENGDIFVGLATMQYLNNFANWGYQEAVEAGITPANLGNAFQWVPTPWIPEARTMIETWANGAPEEKRPGVYAEIVGEFERVHRGTSRWGCGLREAARAVVAEWAKHGAKLPGNGTPVE